MGVGSLRELHVREEEGVRRARVIARHGRRGRLR